MRLQVQELELQRDQQQQELEATDPVDKKAARRLRQLEGRITDQRSAVVAAAARIATIDKDPELSSLAAKHADIADQVLEETLIIRLIRARVAHFFELVLRERFLPCAQTLLTVSVPGAAVDPAEQPLHVGLHNSIYGPHRRRR